MDGIKEAEVLFYHIVPAGWRDLKSIQELEKVCFGRDAYPLLEILGLLTLPGFVCHKAESPGELFGFVVGQRRGKWGAGWIVTVCVHPAYRRRGVARRLIARCEAGLARQRVCLCVRESNQPAIALYRHLGYAVTGTWGGYYQDGENALVMEKSTAEI